MNHRKGTGDPRSADRSVRSSGKTQPFVYLEHVPTPSERRAVSEKQYRYLRYSDGSEELYDILSDPHEWKTPAEAGILNHDFF